MYPHNIRAACVLLALATLCWLGACSSGGSSSPGDPAVDPPDSGSGGQDAENNPNHPDSNTPPEDFLSPVDHLVRASMALKGTRPSVEDMNAVQEDPAALEGIVDAYLDSDAFGATVRDMHDEVLQVRTFFFWFPPRGELNDLSVVEMNRSISEAPLKLVEHIVMNDRPYSEIVTADYTLANAHTAYVWGMEHDGEEDEWLETHWPEEGREHAGLLSDSMVFIRHYSTPLNAQRARANLISKAFLCFDFLKNDIDVGENIDLSDPEKIRNAVKEPGCAGCHNDLDPLSAFFWKKEFFVSPSNLQSYPYSHFKPEYEQYRGFFVDAEPGFFGRPVDSLRGLGEAIAADSRFKACAARRFHSYLTQTSIEETPYRVVSNLQQVLTESNMNARALARAVVLSDAFRASPQQNDPGLAPLQKVRPRQWSRMMEDLTGFTWTVHFDFALDFLGGGTYGRVDLMSDHFLGYEVVAGGTDDFIVTRPEFTMNPTGSLVFENFAYEVAGFVVERDFADGAPDPKRVLEVGPQDAEEDKVRAEIARLYWKILAEEHAPDSEEIDEAWALFSEVRGDDEDTTIAWKATLTALFQDSRLLYY